MINLSLFWAFFKIGLFTIGGGQAMIPLIMKDVVANGWLTENELIDFIAISESTPGAFAINIATYTGIELNGIIGAICATIGLVLPSLIIITLIAVLFTGLMKKKAVNDTFAYVRATVTGLLLSVFISLALTIIFNISNIYNTTGSKVDYIALGMFIVLLPISFIKIKKKRLPLVLIIFIAAIMGLLLYTFIPN